MVRVPLDGIMGMVMRNEEHNGDLRVVWDVWYLVANLKAVEVGILQVE